MRAPILAAMLALAALPAGAQPVPFTPGGPGPEPAAELASTTAFRVCADPANAPMSVKDGSGFENRIAELFAERLGRPLEYTWFPQSTGFIRRTLAAGLCDVVIGYAQGDELVQNTNHYYSSAYVLVTPAEDELAEVTTLSDPRLQGLRLGVIGGSPATDHLLRHGLLARAVSYPLFVDRRVDDPTGRMLADLKAGRIDAAVLWGPLAGPAVKADASLHLAPLIAAEPGMPRLVYRITMGVRPSDQAWKRELNSLIRRNQAEIDAILREAGVPLVDDEGTAMKPEG
ncbi:quinoprotein dehydrogenase-associated putative ABC transporter substrate-binding protein [Paracoccus sp. S-4012]|uniref:substrate-binding domain-containing protein n=1 Tax=Paracoccus sp. S-4012 TaxID=2665648 RepID=UPI0012AF0E4A|nr:quinoprotein dehydrogenase-associated putative ABC transporter substrate-binding protein [Paracoccus sp. S-4012]